MIAYCLFDLPRGAEDAQRRSGSVTLHRAVQASVRQEVSGDTVNAVLDSARDDDSPLTHKE